MRAHSPILSTLALALAIMKNMDATKAIRFCGISIVRPVKTSRKRRAK